MPQNAYEVAGEVQAPVLGLYGAEDQGIPPDQVRQMQEKLKSAGKIDEIEIYPGAPHGFFADYRASYRKAQAEDAWKQATAWFRTYRVLAQVLRPLRRAQLVGVLSRFCFDDSSRPG